MREIKFRTAHFRFSGEFDSFSYWGPLEEDGVSIGFKSPSSISNATSTHHEQFTGLKDKNGVEVYEGDIFGSIYPDEVVRAVVVWGAFGWELQYYRGGKPSLNDIGEEWTIPIKHIHLEIFKVIGNIHQNPELLSNEERVE